MFYEPLAGMGGSVGLKGTDGAMYHKALELGAQEGNKKVVMLESTSDTAYEAYFQALAAISASGGVVAIVEEAKE